jgi:hypothetical protein
MGNEVLPHARQHPFRQSFRQALLLLGSHTEAQALGPFTCASVQQCHQREGRL